MLFITAVYYTLINRAHSFRRKFCRIPRAS